MTDVVAFDPVPVWTRAGFPADHIATFAGYTGWTEDLLERTIALARHAVASGSALAREYAKHEDLAVVMSIVSVNLADRMGMMPTRGWQVDRALPWVALAVCDTDSKRAWSLTKAAALWVPLQKPIEELDEHLWGLVNTWSPVDPEVAYLAYGAGLSHAEALERQAAGTLDAVELATMTALRGYLLPTVI